VTSTGYVVPSLVSVPVQAIESGLLVLAPTGDAEIPEGRLVAAPTVDSVPTWSGVRDGELFVKIELSGVYVSFFLPLVIRYLWIKMVEAARTPCGGVSRVM
jgi:hypothetical protein